MCVTCSMRLPRKPSVHIMEKTNLSGPATRRMGGKRLGTDRMFGSFPHEMKEVNVMKKRNKRMMSMVTLFAVAATLLAGVAGCSQEGSSGGKTSTKDSIVIATMSETPSLTPNEHNAVAGGYMNLLTYEGLLYRDMDMKSQPCLAESYEAVSETEWDFKIRKGVKFHTGEEMTVEDVKASLDWAQNFPLIKTSTENIKQVDIIDDETIRITTHGPCAVILDNLTGTSNAIVPKKLIDAGNNFNENPIGTGPYVFKTWNLGDSLEFEAFEDYWGGEPAIKHMTWKIIPEGSSRTIALEAGEVDFVVEVETMDMDRITSNEDLEVYQYEGTELQFMQLNNEVPGLDNSLVRHAINSAINKEDVVTVAVNNLGTPAKSQTPINLVGTSDEGADEYNVEKAREYLAESGVNPSDIYFSIICSNDMKKRAAEVIQANLKEIGITCDIESMDLATYLSTTTEGNFTACLGGYNTTDQLLFVQGMYHSESIGGSNRSRLNDPKVDAYIDQAMVTLDAEERQAILEELNAYLNEVCTLVPLWQTVAVRAYNADLKGVEINAVGNLYFKDCYWE